MVSEPLRTGKVQQGVVLVFCFFGWSCCERAMRGHCVEHLKQSLGCMQYKLQTVTDTRVMGHLPKADYRSRQTELDIGHGAVGFGTLNFGSVFPHYVLVPPF